MSLAQTGTELEPLPTLGRSRRDPGERRASRHNAASGASLANAEPFELSCPLVLAGRQAWAVLWMAGLAGCARDRPSTAPLAAGPEGAPQTEAVPSPSVAPASAASAKPVAATKSAGKRALYRRSCELGSALACNELGVLLIADPAQAWPLLERACTLGLARGCANWGAQLLTAPGGSRDRAIEVLTRACEQSDEFGCLELANGLYDDAAKQGNGYGRAFEAYQKSCKLGNATACSSEGWMSHRGEGTAKDAQRARELFRFACDRKVYAGCSGLGYDLVTSAKNGDDQEEGARHLQVACEHDDAFGCFTLGALTLTRAAPSSIDDGLGMLKRACALGMQTSCTYVSAVEKRLKLGLPPFGDDAATPDP